MQSAFTTNRSRQPRPHWFLGGFIATSEVAGVVAWWRSRVLHARSRPQLLTDGRAFAAVSHTGYTLPTLESPNCCFSHAPPACSTVAGPFLLVVALPCSNRRPLQCSW